MDTEEQQSEDGSMEYLVKRSLLSKNKLAIILKEGDEVQYCCVQCPVRSTYKEELEKHLLTHNMEYKHLCGICGTGLKRREHLERHTLEHQQVRPHVCSVCNKAFKRKEHLNVHMSIHNGEKTEVCMLCQKSFYRKDHLQKHLQTHGKVLMEQSMQILGDTELLQLKTELADEEYNTPPHSEEDNEMPTESSILLDTRKMFNEARPHACQLCEKTYKRKDHLKLHLQTHMKKERACSECGKTFAREEQLLAHMSVHLNAFSMEYEEDNKTELHAMLGDHILDPSTFLTENSLLVPRHSVPVDMSERRHECDICHKRFKRRQHLKVHYNVHRRSEPLLRCLKCNKGCNTDAELDNHLCSAVCIPIQHELNIKIAGAAGLGNRKENKHPIDEAILPMEAAQEDATQYIIQDESSIPVPQKVFVCKWCQKPFKRKDHYKIHLHIHTGIKSFFCPDCGKGFYRKDHLQKHSQVHSGKPKQPKPKKPLPGLLSLDVLMKMKNVKPEITITAPSKLRVPLQIKVPYQMVLTTDSEQECDMNVDPQSVESTKTYPVNSSQNEDHGY